MPPESQEQSRVPTLTVSAKVPKQERLATGYRFGSLTAKRVADILKNLERGYLRDWGDLSEYMVKSDTTLWSVYHTRKISVVRQPWYLEPGVARGRDQESVAQQAAELCERVLDGTTDLRGAMLDLMGGTGEGVALSEIIWGRAGDLYVPDQLKWRHIRRFRYDDDWRLRLYDRGVSTGGMFGEELPPNKFIIHQPRDHAGYPTRNGAHLAAVWLWLFKRWTEKGWARVVEKHGLPFVHGKVPRGTPENVRDDLLTDLTRMSYDHIAVMEDGNSIEIDTSGMQAVKGESPQQTLIRYVNEEFAKLHRGYTDATGPGENGARAAVESREESSGEPRVQHDGEQLWETLRRDLLTPILWFNRHRFGGIMPPVPHGVFGTQESTTGEIRIGVLNQGVIRVNEARAAEGLPPLAEGEVTGEGLKGEDFLPNVSMLQSQGPDPGAGGGGLPGFADEEPAGGQADDHPFRRKRKTRRSSRARQMSLPLETTTSRTFTRSPTSPLARVLSDPSVGPAPSSKNPRSR